MRKTALCLLCMLLLSVTILSACSNHATPVLLTGGEQGTYYSLGNALSEMLQSNEDEHGDKDKSKFTAAFTVRSTSGHREIFSELSQGKPYFTIARSDILWSATNGTGVYQNEKIEGLKLVAELYDEVVHLAVREGIKAVQHLTAKKICLGERDSAGAIIAKQILAAAGVQSYTAVYLSPSAAANALKSGEIDAFFLISGIASSVITELSKSLRFEIIGIDEATINNLCNQYPYYSKYFLSKKQYNVLKESIYTLSLRACLVATDKVDDDLVYNIVKRIAEDSSYLLNHKKYQEITPEKMWSQNAIPLHKGAERYKNEYKKSK